MKFLTAARLVVYGGILLGGLFLAVQIREWFTDLENPGATIYRTRVKTVYVEAEPTKEWKRADKTLYPCVPVVARTAQSTSTDGHPTPSSSQTVQPLPPSHTPARTPNPQSADSEPESSAPPTYPLLLGEWKLPPLPQGGTARSFLQSDGVTHLETKPFPRSFLALGRERSATLWYGRDSLGGPTYSVSLASDLLRVGPVMFVARVEYGRFVSDQADHARYEIGMSVRF